MRVLVAVASKYGATQEIAEAIGTGLRRRGVETTVLPIGEVASLDGFDAVVLGSAVYAGHWLKEARHAVQTFQGPLSTRAVWLFSSGPVGGKRLLPEGEAVDVASLMEDTGARGHTVFAGRIDETQLGFIERSMIHALHAETGDFRDWDAIDAYAAQLATEMATISVPARATN